MNRNQHGCLAHFVALAGFMTLTARLCSASEPITLIDFENIPPCCAPVSSFGHLFPGLTLESVPINWVANEADSGLFESIYNRAISTPSAFRFVSTPLQITFDSPVRDVAMDFGSGTLGYRATVNVTGYLGNQMVFMNTFVTHPVPAGADEVHAQNIGIVDRIVVDKLPSDTTAILDNLSFYAVPEPPIAALFAIGGLVLSLNRFLSYLFRKKGSAEERAAQPGAPNAGERL